MPSDLLMLVDGLRGELEDADYPDAMSLSSWTLGISRSTAVGANRNLGSASASDLVVTGSLDRMVQDMANFATMAKPVTKKVTLIQRRPGGSATAEVMLELELEEVVFTSVSYASVEGLPHVTISMNYARITFSYYVQSDDGQKTECFPWSWDATNAS